MIIYMCSDHFLLLFLFQICFLTLLSTYKDGMRVVTIRETYSLCNNTERDFHMQLYNIPLAEQKVKHVYKAYDENV